MLFKERMLEEAGKTFNPSYSKPLQNVLTKASNVLPKNIGGQAAGNLASGIGAKRKELASTMRAARKNENKVVGRADAAAMSNLTSPYAKMENHPNFKKLKEGGMFSGPKSNEEICLLYTSPSPRDS